MASYATAYQEQGPKIFGGKSADELKVRFGLYWIFVYFEASVQESTILSPLRPPALHLGAVLLHE